MSVRTDETGLHAEDCPCLLCETGYRPTPRERELARRAYLAAKRAREAALNPEQPPKPARAMLPAYKMPPPLTAEELELMRKMRLGR
jgi:hypothetical protein